MSTPAGAARADTCTVTGPTIIDFKSQLNNVTDRCAYSVMKDSSNGFEVFANFRERRRRDVSFVDSVTLLMAGSGVAFHLEQGGRVLVSYNAEQEFDLPVQLCHIWDFSNLMFPPFFFLLYHADEQHIAGPEWFSPTH